MGKSPRFHCTIILNLISVHPKVFFMARFRLLVNNNNPEGDCDVKRLQFTKKKRKENDGKMLRFNNHSFHY